MYQLPSPSQQQQQDSDYVSISTFAFRTDDNNASPWRQPKSDDKEIERISSTFSMNSDDALPVRRRKISTFDAPTPAFTSAFISAQTSSLSPSKSEQTSLFTNHDKLTSSSPFNILPAKNAKKFSKPRRNSSNHRLNPMAQYASSADIVSFSRSSDGSVMESKSVNLDLKKLEDKNKNFDGNKGMMSRSSVQTPAVFKNLGSSGLNGMSSSSMLSQSSLSSSSSSSLNEDYDQRVKDLTYSVGSMFKRYRSPLPPSPAMNRNKFVGNNNTRPSPCPSSSLSKDNGSNQSILANNLIDGWVRSFELEKKSYDSISVFAEVRLREALACTEEIQNDTNTSASTDGGDTSEGGPSQVRAALCCDLLMKVSSVFGRYEGLVKKLTTEVLRCVYEDYDSFIDSEKNAGRPIDARTFYTASPFFSLYNSLTIKNEELEEELEDVNAGDDIKAALAKGSAGMRTLFNGARSTIRDMIFKVWKAYVMARMRKMRALRLRVAEGKYFILWKQRYRRWKDRGYFYDSDSEDDEEKAKVSNRRALREAMLLDVEKEWYDLPEVEHDNLHESDPPSLETAPTSEAAGRQRGVSLKGMFMRGANKIGHSLRESSMIVKEPFAESIDSKKRLKFLSEEIEADTGRVLKHCERRRYLVTLVDCESQTDFFPDPIIANSGALVNALDGSHSFTVPNTPTSTKKIIDVSAQSLLGGGKKEKAMSLDSSLTLIPEFYEQYCRMLSDSSQHMNLISFIRSFLMRKFGIKQIAAKHFKSFIGSLITKKGLAEPRIRLLARLIGLSGGDPGEDPGGYDEDRIDFFFKSILSTIFPDLKHLGATMNSSAALVDRGKVLDSLGHIFTKIQAKDGLKVLYIEREVERMKETTVKGIPYVNCDDLLEILEKHAKLERFLNVVTKQQFNTLKNFLITIRKKVVERRNGRSSLGAAATEMHAQLKRSMTRRNSDIKLQELVNNAIDGDFESTSIGSGRYVDVDVEEEEKVNLNQNENEEERGEAVVDDERKDVEADADIEEGNVVEEVENIVEEM